jgi:hypothetical protein
MIYYCVCQTAGFGIASNQDQKDLNGLIFPLGNIQLTLYPLGLLCVLEGMSFVFISVLLIGKGYQNIN